MTFYDIFPKRKKKCNAGGKFPKFNFIYQKRKIKKFETSERC